MTNDYHEPFDRDLLGNKTKPAKNKKREGVRSFAFFRQLRLKQDPRETHAESWNEYLKYLRDRNCISPKMLKRIK